MHGSIGIHGHAGSPFHRAHAAHTSPASKPFWQQPWYQQQQRIRAGGAWVAARNARNQGNPTFAAPPRHGSSLGMIVGWCISIGLFLFALPKLLELLHQLGVI